MNEKVRLYYQVVGGLPAWDFCADAWLGARYRRIDAIPFEFIDKVPDGPSNIIVGSVEESTKWLIRNGYEVPQEIDITPTVGRTATTVERFLGGGWDSLKPVFFKPKGQIKAFTGTVVGSSFEAEIVLGDYKGEIWVYDEVVDFISEWRTYIHRGKIIKIAHYRGLPDIFPDPTKIYEYVYSALKNVRYNSFTVDVGVVNEAGAMGNYPISRLIEGNDGWAIANYGLEPEVYFDFVKDRWFQLTGLLT